MAERKEAAGRSSPWKEGGGRHGDDEGLEEGDGEGLKEGEKSFLELPGGAAARRKGGGKRGGAAARRKGGGKCAGERRGVVKLQGVAGE